MQLIVDLSQLKPLFHGSNRIVYIHPENPDLLIKVPHWRTVDNFNKRVSGWKKRFKLLGGGLPQSYREFYEYMRLNLSAVKDMPHIFSSAGMIRTSQGWGHVVKAERGADGEYAPTLASIIHEPEKYEQPLAEFLQWIENTPTVFTNLEPWNLVLAWRRGKNELVSIDGIGDRSSVPFRAYFPWLNKRDNRPHIKKLLWRIEELKHKRIDAAAQKKIDGTIAGAAVNYQSPENGDKKAPPAQAGL